MYEHNEFQDFKEVTKYKIYIGLNDKSYNKQLIKTPEAIKLVEEICKTYFTGFTIYCCDGYYKSKCNNPSIEKNILIEAINPTPDSINNSCLDLKKALSQKSILIEVEKIHYKLFQ